MSENNLCRVCNAPALFINFGARSCSSCKMFFKRNAEQPKVRKRNYFLENFAVFFKERFSCKFENHCEMNMYTRRFCSACRLAKCFASGMRMELIRGFRGKKNLERTSTNLSQVKKTTNNLDSFLNTQ